MRDHRPYSSRSWLRLAVLACAIACAFAPCAPAQDTEPVETPEVVGTPDGIDVRGVVPDAAIAARIESVLKQMEVYDALEVDVRNGVVTLRGVAKNEELKNRAREIARETEDVVVVMNRLTVPAPKLLDFTESNAEIRRMSADFVRALPKLAVAVGVLCLAVLAMILISRFSRLMLRRRIHNRLLLGVTSRAIGIGALIIGVYIALRLAGLTQLAVTVISGTGILGLIIGIAFRDIAENFLASLLISTQRPFATGDTIKVAGEAGIVQTVTTRGTLLMAFDGSYIHIPNSTIYKSTILNVSANPKTRLDFTVGVGYDVSLAKAQAVALEVVQEHSAVLDEPSPSVLVEELGASSVVLRVYFWFDANAYSGLKVKSAVIRLVNGRFQDAGISMPDDAREVIFPDGVPVHMVEPATPGRPPAAQRTEPEDRPGSDDDDAEASPAEGALRSDDESIQAQADMTQLPDQGANLLEDAD